MTKFKSEIKQPKSCYSCKFNTIFNEDLAEEWWGCDELYGVPVGTNPPYDEPCDLYRERKSDGNN